MKTGGFVLLNGLTGAVDILNNELAQIMITKMNETDHRNILINDDLLPSDIKDSFIERGHITYISHEQEQQQIKKLAETLHNIALSQRKIVIVPSLDCNYRCVYCFERPLQNKLDPNSISIMDKETVDKVYSAIAELRDCGNVIDTQLLLYGGEPLNASNKKIVFEIVEKGIREGFSFTAITNGHDLDVYLPLLGKGKIANIQVSIDGPKLIHDKLRISRDGTSSFDKVIMNIKRVLVETDTMIEIRVHINKGNIGHFAELIDTFSNEGWLNNDRLHIHISVIYLKNNNGEVTTAYDILSMGETLKQITDMYSNITIGCSEYNHESNLITSLYKNIPFMLKSDFCAATHGMYIFLPNGNIHSCWESIGDDGSLIGNYKSNESICIDQEKHSCWFGRSVAKILECTSCQYCLICGGGCPQYALYNTGSLYKPFCNNFQATYPTVLANAVEKYIMENVGKYQPYLSDILP